MPEQTDSTTEEPHTGVGLPPRDRVVIVRTLDPEYELRSAMLCRWVEITQEYRLLRFGMNGSRPVKPEHWAEVCGGYRWFDLPEMPDE